MLFSLKRLQKILNFNNLQYFKYSKDAVIYFFIVASNYTFNIPVVVKFLFYLSDLMGTDVTIYYLVPQNEVISLIFHFSYAIFLTLFNIFRY